MTLFYEMEMADALDGADIVDLCSGPRGWSEGGRLIDPDFVDIGLELDRWANSTARAAGHEAIECNIAEVDPLDYLGCVGLIASPPCQAFSTAGKGHGRGFLEPLLAAIAARDWSARPSTDPNVWLVLEVGRWAEVLRPEWICCEQVPGVLPIWEAYASMLEADGYSVWCGNLHAEEYGAPQTRTRAVLIASRTREVSKPTATHQRYVKGVDRWSAAVGGVLPWVSMADALGWGMTERPAVTLAPGTGKGGPDSMGAGGSAARALVENERDAGRWVVDTGRSHGQRDSATGGQIRSVTEPAPSVTAKSGGQWHLGEPDHLPRADDRERLAEPEANERYDDRAGSEAIRLTIEQALVLQTFPADYPVQGGRTKQFEQIGNAVPPMLAAAVLREVL